MPSPRFQEDTAAAERLKEFAVYHEEWLRHPVTKKFIEMLNNHKQHIAGKIAVASGDPNVTDAQIRQFATQLKTVATIEMLATETAAFLNKLKE
jgi:hypothetical protein